MKDKVYSYFYLVCLAILLILGIIDGDWIMILVGIIGMVAGVYDLTSVNRENDQIDVLLEKLKHKRRNKNGIKTRKI